MFKIAFPDIFTTLDDLSMRHIDTFARANYPMVEYLAQDLNFQINLRQVDNYGWKDADGNFDGLMGLFQNNIIEMGAMGILMRMERIEVVDFAGETFEIK